MPSRKTLAMISTLLVMGFLTVLIVLSMYGGSDTYTPTTDDPATIFREACARCHGEGGVGGGDDGIGPALRGRNEPAAEVIEHVREGKGRMPRFPNLQGRPLENLAVYVSGL